MTDRTIIPLAGGFDLMVAPHPGGVRVSLLPSGGVSLLPSGGAPGHVTATVNTGALLTAIDRADSDALRAYLRERSDLMDSPHDAAAEHFDYLDTVPEADSPEDVLTAEDLAARAARLQHDADARLDAVPEADSPEDVDEHPGADFPADDELMGTRTGRLLLIQRVAHLYPSATTDEHRAVAEWIIGTRAEPAVIVNAEGLDPRTVADRLREWANR